MSRAFFRFLCSTLLLLSAIGCASTSKTSSTSAPDFAEPLSGRINSAFSMRIDRDNGITRIHHGIDIKGRTGATIRASASGKVIAAEWQRGYGKIVIIDHGGGWQSRYAHLSGFSVRSGARVAQGEKIGQVGQTGNATGPHLHFEIRQNGRPLNPLALLR